MRIAQLLGAFGVAATLLTAAAPVAEAQYDPAMGYRHHTMMRYRHLQMQRHHTMMRFHHLQAYRRHTMMRHMMKEGY